VGVPALENEARRPAGLGGGWGGGVSGWGTLVPEKEVLVDACDDGFAPGAGAFGPGGADADVVPTE